MSTYIKWEILMKEEIDSLLQNQTWILVELPKGKRALTNKWVYSWRKRETVKRGKKQDLW